MGEQVRAQIQRLQAALERFEVLVETQKEGSHQQRAAEKQLSAVQQAQWHLAVAQSVHLAFLLYLRAQGKASSDHPLHKETERLKFYAKKVRKLESEEYLSTHKPSMEVNVAAANRFITHAIPDLNKEQKAALRKTAIKRKAMDGDRTADAARKFLMQTLGNPKSKQQ